MGVVGIILAILGASAPYLPLIDKMLVGFGVFLANEFKQLFGTDAPVQLEGAVATAEQVVSTVEADLPAAIAWLKNNFASLDDLAKNEPGVVKAMFANAQVVEAHGISKGAAAKLIENSHGAMVAKNVKP